jgi:CRP-like cAMP-binding protein
MKIYPELQQYCRGILPLEDSVSDAFAKIWKPVSYKRKEVISVAGQVEEHLYFVMDGVQRIYYLDDDGREATVVLTYPYSFGGVADSFLCQQTSRFYYETLTPSSLLRTSFGELQLIRKELPSVDQLLQRVTHFALSGVLERMVELQCFSSEEKFKKLLSRSPHILQLVPHKYLANYLGIDPTNFSKLINKVKI